jgi:ABC-type dipeptide/oligopeptide/nickel transport system permease subunit
MAAKSSTSSPGRMALRRLLRNRLAVVGLVLVVLVVIVGIMPGVFAPHDPLRPDKAQFRVGPGAPGHLLGTDELGRDMLSRLMYGAGISLRVGVAGAAAAVFIGVIIGALAGFYLGWVDWLLTQLIDTFFAFPNLLLAIGILAIFERPGESVMFWALGLVGWLGIARIVRGEVITLRERDFVMAAHALGQRQTIILARHVLPNCLGPIIVVATLLIGGNILSEAGLSFLGIGLPPPAPSWGRMLVDSKELWIDKPWMGILPGFAIVLTLLGFNLLGDGLRDAFDPRMRA